MSGRDFVRDIPLDLPENEPRHDVLATLWARTRVDDLMSQDYNGIQSGTPRPDVSEAITQLGIEYRLMTQFTSFVAVEEMTVTDGGKPRRIEVPVDLPDGVSHEGVFNTEQSRLARGSASAKTHLPSPPPPPPMAGASETVTVTSGQVRADKRKNGSGRGSPGGVAGGVGVGDGSGRGPGRGYGGYPDRAVFSAEQQKRQQLLSRLHPSIAGLLDRLKDKNAKPGADESRFVREGKAEIQIWLSVKNSQAIAELKRLGFEVVLDPPASRMVIGRVPLEKLAALVEMNLIRYVAPMTSN
jgi:Ca-activated chloride channel family protein